MKEHLLKTLENSRNYTIAVASSMPENLYDTKPADSIWNFRELMHHIAYGIEWWENNYVKKTEIEWNPTPVSRSKNAVIEYLNKVYDSLTDTVQAKETTQEVINGFHATTDHITHHRGQAIVHLRCNNIAPPDYTY